MTTTASVRLPLFTDIWRSVLRCESWLRYPVLWRNIDPEKLDAVARAWWARGQGQSPDQDALWDVDRRTRMRINAVRLKMRWCMALTFLSYVTVPYAQWADRLAGRR